MEIGDMAGGGGEKGWLFRLSDERNRVKEKGG